MRYVLSLLFVAAVFGCSQNDSEPQSVRWKKLGLDGKIVNELHLQENFLYAATDGGLYKKSVENDDDFQLLGFDNKNIEAVLIRDNSIIVSVKDNNQQGHLYESADGVEWHEVENNFGGENNEVIRDLEVDPNDNSTIYGTGTVVVAKSTDGGKSWQPLHGDWDGFGTGTDVVKVNPYQDEQIWAGGQGAIENGYLWMYNGEGDWTEWLDLVENPSVVKAITFGDENNVYVGFEGALLSTTNNGSSWNTLISSDENRFFFGVGKSTKNSDLLFAGGWLKRFDDPQPLILFISSDNGATWRQEKYPSEDFGGIQDLKVVSENNREKLFLGLYKGGVYEVDLQRDYIE